MKYIFIILFIISIDMSLCLYSQNCEDKIQIILNDTNIIQSTQEGIFTLTVINNNSYPVNLPGINSKFRTNYLATLEYIYHQEELSEYSFNIISLQIFIQDANMKFIVPHSDIVSSIDYSKGVIFELADWIDSLNFNFLNSRSKIFCNNVKDWYETSLLLSGNDTIKIDLQANLWGFNIKPGNYFCFVVYYVDDCERLEKRTIGNEPIITYDEMTKIFGDNYFQGLVKSNTAVLIYVENQ